MSIVSIGGGTGLPNLLRGLMSRARGRDISAIVTTFDDGGSSGDLRRQRGIPALGDLRRCLTSLAADDADSAAVAEIFDHRFDAGAGRHSLGNLILASLLEIHGDLNAAVNHAARMLNSCGAVIPVATQPGHLRARLRDGTWIESESAIDQRGMACSPIDRVELREPVPANPRAVEAIERADVITAGPGDLYTSVIPNLLPTGIADAIRASEARLVFICNVSNKPAETACYGVSDYVATFNSYISPRKADVAIVNMPAAGDPEAVRVDPAAYDVVPMVVATDLASATNPGHHDPGKLAEAVIDVVRRGE